jgi:hypothetical protein
MNSKRLQVNDFVAGAVFQMLESGRTDYYDSIGHKVMFGGIVEKYEQTLGGV